MAKQFVKSFLLSLAVGGLGVAHAELHPGLLGGYLSNSSVSTEGQNNYPTEKSVYSSPHSATNSNNAVNPMGQYRVWVYTGFMHFDGSTYAAKAFFDDMVFFKVDDDYIIKYANDWNNTYTQTFKPSAGWHAVEFRFGNNTGGYERLGGADSNGIKTGFALAKIADGAEAPSNWSAYTYPIDPGDGSLFRYDDGVDVAGIVAFRGAPSSLPVPGVDYTRLTDVAKDAGKVFSVPEGWQEYESGRYANCSGWKIYTVAVEDGEERETFWRSGEGCTIGDYVHPGVKTVVEWQWKVAAGAQVALGTVVPAYSRATVQIDVGGLGLEDGPSGELSLVWGLSQDALTKTCDCGTVTEIGSQEATLTGLLPASTYYVQAVLETSDGVRAVSSVLSFATKKPTYATAGLLGGYLNNVNPNNTTSQPEAWEMRLSPEAAYTWYGTPGYCVWVYKGQMAFDGSTYAFAFHYDDSVCVKIDGQTVHNRYNNYQTYTYATCKPTAGWHDVELRFGNAGGGFGHNGKTDCNGQVTGWGITRIADGATAPEGMANYEFPADPGDGSVYRVLGETYAGGMTVVENVGASGLESVTLTFAASDAPRSLVRVTGSDFAGPSASDWATQETVASIAAGQTEATVAVPANWGADGCTAMMFFLSGAVYSEPVFHRAGEAPVVSGVTVDSTGGDTVVVSGRLDSFAGESCTIRVKTGRTSDAIDQSWSDLVLTETGAFQMTLHESDVASARYIRGGEPLFVTVLAMANGETGSGGTIETVPAGAPSVYDVGSSVNRRTCTFTGKLLSIGACGRATVRLLVGESAETMVQIGESAVIEDLAEPISLTQMLERFNTTYSWCFETVAAAAGGTTNFVARTSVRTVQTRDVTTYTWKPEVASGNWRDAANWTDNREGDSFGYPATYDAVAAFSADTTAKITLDGDVQVGAMDVTAANLDIELKTDGAARALTTDHSNRRAFDFTGGNGCFVLGSGVKLDSGGVFSIGGNDFVISNATLVVDAAMWIGTKRMGGSLRFEGETPLLRFTGSTDGIGNSFKEGGAVIEFVVPKGGYATAPIFGQTVQSFGYNVTAPFSFVISKRSPCRMGPRAVDTPLMAWTPNNNWGENRIETDKFTLGPARIISDNLRGTGYTAGAYHLESASTFGDKRCLSVGASISPCRGLVLTFQ